MIHESLPTLCFLGSITTVVGGAWGGSLRSSNTTSRIEHTCQSFKHWVIAMLDSNILKRDYPNLVFLRFLIGRGGHLNILILQSNLNLRLNKWSKSSPKCMWSAIDMPKKCPFQESTLWRLLGLLKARNWWTPKIARAFRIVIPKKNTSKWGHCHSFTCYPHPRRLEIDQWV